MAAIVKTVGGPNAIIGVYGEPGVSRCAFCSGTGEYKYRYSELGDDPENIAVTDALMMNASDHDRMANRWRYIEQASRAIRALDAFRERQFDPPAEDVETDAL